MSRSFEITEPARDLRMLLLVAMLGPILIVLAVLYGVAKPSPPAIVPIMVLVIAIAPFFMLSRWLEQRQVTLEGNSLVVVAGSWKQAVGVADIDLEHARALRLDEHPEWRPFMRTGGLGLPGLSLGWFRTRDLTRLYCLLTDRERVLVLPLRGRKEALLLSLKHPDQLLSALRGTGDAQGRGR